MAGWARRADVIKQFIAMGRIAHLKNSSNGAEIFLVGTAHVSAKSAEEVEEVIGIVKPDIVAVELCEERAKKLLAGYHDTSLFQKVQEFMKFPGGLKQKVVHLALSASYQAMREAGLEPGKEFKVAMEEAKARRAGILLIDQRYDVRPLRSCAYCDYFKAYKGDQDTGRHKLAWDCRGGHGADCGRTEQRKPDREH
ncbi:traB domain-containing protein isoform X1 [Selaginella moellendorffii]|uniref:traB domain-containing protein isoform X1 n=1 Tax=Selaginella moellendorffii TaxID=88036 RepID=UPI000D1C97DB|nr:traB domain-containing protein isoform X1 [Selaginella moellendorffii]|eukprot:XP_024540151.1 traB domain-containing protein isoform X1 [Selaginella moellendorffii]